MIETAELIDQAGDEQLEALAIVIRKLKAVEPKVTAYLNRDETPVPGNEPPHPAEAPEYFLWEFSPEELRLAFVVFQQMREAAPQAVAGWESAFTTEIGWRDVAAEHAETGF